VSCLVGLIINEVAIHGYDLSRANGSRWRIPASWGHTALRALSPVFPLALDTDAAAGVSSTYDLRMRGDDAPRIVVRIADSNLTVHQPGAGGKVDCYLAGDPLAMLLVLYGRRTPIAASVRGQALAWGRKPWRGLTRMKYFKSI
jgi:hypothetical protein